MVLTKFVLRYLKVSHKAFGELLPYSADKNFFLNSILKSSPLPNGLSIIFICIVVTYLNTTRWGLYTVSVLIIDLKQKNNVKYEIEL